MSLSGLKEKKKIGAPLADFQNMLHGNMTWSEFRPHKKEAKTLRPSLSHIKWHLLTSFPSRKSFTHNVITTGESVQCIMMSLLQEMAKLYLQYMSIDNTSLATIFPLQIVGYR